MRMRVNSHKVKTDETQTKQLHMSHIEQVRFQTTLKIYNTINCLRIGSGKSFQRVVLACYNDLIPWFSSVM